jgi:hypothetical protein
MENLTAENKLLLALSKIEINNDDRVIIDNLILSVNDWNYVYECAVFQGIGSLISKHFFLQRQAEIIPKSIISKLNQIYYRSLSRNMILYEHFQKIAQTFSANNIAVIPLKGIFLAETYYHDIGLRQMSDIDLLVKYEDVQNCIQILSDLGYEAIGRVKTEFIKNKGVAKHLPTMSLNNVLVEIHFRILVDDSIHIIEVEEYWKNASPTILFNIPTLTLLPENLLQYLCIHLERHFNEGKIQLYQFADMVGILQKNKDFDWELFELSCKKNHCWKNVLPILFLLQKFFLVSYPEKIQQLALQHSSKKTEDLFISFLKCNKEEILFGIENQNIKNLRKIKGIQNKFRFLIGDIFPSRLFMYQRYHIRQKPLVLAYYILRLTIGFSMLIRHVYRTLLKKI